MKQYLKKIKPLHQGYLYLLKKQRLFYNWLYIPSYEVKRKTIINTARKYRCSEVFIETGTYMGDTVEYLKNYFNKLISIELSEELAGKAQKRFEDEKKIQIIQGDSAKQLSVILATINTPVVFWLDGHYSSEFWDGKNYIITAKSEKETPVLEELTQIVHHHVKNHVILIDDARLFNGKDDYPEINVLRNFVSKNFVNHSVKIKNDIIRILPTK